MPPQSWTPLTAHPFASMFPLRRGPSLDELTESIKADGLKEEIVVYCGQVLDGRRRQIACLRASVKPLYRDFGSRAGDGFDPLNWTFTVNFHRRDLTPTERALAADAFADMKRGYNQHSKPNGAKPVSRREAAEKFGTSRNAIDRARRVNANGTPELREAAATETVSLSDAAAIAGEAPEVQRQALESVQAGEARTLQAAVADIHGLPADDPDAICRELDRLKERVQQLGVGTARQRERAANGIEAARTLVERLGSISAAA